MRERAGRRTRGCCGSRFSLPFWNHEKGEEDAPSGPARGVRRKAGEAPRRPRPPVPPGRSRVGRRLPFRSLRRLWESGVESLNNWLTATRTPSDRRLISKPLSRQVTRARGVSLRRKSHDGGSHRKTSAEPMKERDGERRQAGRGAGTSPGGVAGATPARGQEPPEGEGDAGGASEPGCSTFPF